MMEIGEKIAALRKTDGMTQSELGSKLNVTFQAVSKWERGESYPDFETVSKLAKLFNVPIGYFEKGGELFDEPSEEEDDGETDTAAVVDAENVGRAIVGFCKVCNKIVYQNEEASTSPAVVCKACAVRRENAKRATENELKAQKEKQERQASEKQRAENARARTLRNRGLIWAAPITLIWIIIYAIICYFYTYKSGGEIALDATLYGVVVYTFAAQMFWHGVVFNVCTFGGKIVGTPGVIFTLDLDGLIFLVGVKILFAVIRIIIYVLSLLLMAVIAIIIAPFTFIPQLVKICSGHTLD